MSRMTSDKAGRRARRQSSEEFKAGAVRLVVDESKTVGAVARELIGRLRRLRGPLIRHADVMPDSRDEYKCEMLNWSFGPSGGGPEPANQIRSILTSLLARLAQLVWSRAVSTTLRQPGSVFTVATPSYR